MPRVNITISEELHKWFANRSESIGTSMSGLMSTALYDYYESRQYYSAQAEDTLRRNDSQNNVVRGKQRSTIRSSR